LPRIEQRKFDFDQWAALARDDPAGFERQRRARVDALILRALPEQRRRLRGLQFRIDMERRRARTPMAACVRLQSLMWDTVAGPDGFYDRLLGMLRPVSRFGQATRKPQDGPLPCARIIPFPTSRPRPRPASPPE
jgi:hypothetical protein